MIQCRDGTLPPVVEHHARVHEHDAREGVGVLYRPPESPGATGAVQDQVYSVDPDLLEKAIKMPGVGFGRAVEAFWLRRVPEARHVRRHRTSKLTDG